jgi:hypothetical protein
MSCKDLCCRGQYVREVGEIVDSNFTCRSLRKGEYPYLSAWLTGCKAKELSPGHCQYRFSADSAVLKHWAWLLLGSVTSSYGCGLELRLTASLIHPVGRMTKRDMARFKAHLYELY